ncbi:agmatine deiminase family protein [Teredinibacter turnerae]|uniref:agmatine deiminase family protein n=1 Tax=Teredinibacter turnerae TaxID=2426 RepID=UPI0005F7B912|nr:agmatine deiminase family protein [Teredinibacter turnerae]
MISSFQLAPEYGPVSTVLMALPYAGSDWDYVLDDVLDCYGNIVESLLAQDKNIQLLMLVKPDSRSKGWAESLALDGESRARLTLIDSVGYDDTWTRDYGPLSSTCGGRASYLTCTFNGWGGKYNCIQDNLAAGKLAPWLGSTVTSYDLVVEGGALEVNGQGVLLANADCIVDDHRNGAKTRAELETELKKRFGLQRIEWVSNINLTGDDTDGHIDTIARFVADDMIVACGRNPQHPDAEQLESLYSQLSSICQRNHWQLVELPVPQVRSRVDQRLLPATYANFLICNRTLLLPVYGAEEDERATAILRELLPQFQVVPVDCSALVEQHGSLHCATMQIA